MNNKINIAGHLESLNDKKELALEELLKGDISFQSVKNFNDVVSEYNKGLENIRKVSSRNMSKFYNA